MNYFKQVLIAFSFLTATTILAQDKTYLLVLSKTKNEMIVLNYTSLDFITAIPVGEDPHEIVLSDDSSLAYISNPNMKKIGHEINIVDLKTLKHQKTINTFPLLIPHGLVYQNDRLWFTAQGSKAVAVYNTKKDQIEEILGTGQDFTHLLYVTADANRFYTSNVESGTISIFENKTLPPYMPPTGFLPANAQLRTEWRQTLLNVGYGCEGFDITADEKELWTVLPDGHIVVVDLVYNKIKTKIDTHVEGLHRIKFTPDGKTACIVSVKTGDLLFYNKQLQLEKRMNIGQGAGIYMDEKNNRMFVSCTPNNYVSVIDLASRKEIKRLNIGRPDSVTVAFLKN